MEENSIQNIIAGAVVCSSTKLERKGKAPVEQRDCLWWQHGYHNWTNEQSKRRLRVNRDTLNFTLNSIEEDDVQMPLKLVKELLKSDFL